MGIRGGKPRRFILYDALEDLNSCPRPRPSTSIELSVGAFCTITVILKIRRTGRPFVQKRPGDGSSSSSIFCVEAEGGGLDGYIGLLSFIGTTACSGGRTWSQNGHLGLLLAIWCSRAEACQARRKG